MSKYSLSKTNFTNAYPLVYNTFSIPFISLCHTRPSSNPRVPCSSMPQVDLSQWRENVQGCQIGNRHVRVGESAFPSPCTSCVCSAEGVSFVQAEKYH